MCEGVICEAVICECVICECVMCEGVICEGVICEGDRDASRDAYVLGPPPSRGGGLELEGGVNVSL